MGVCMDACEWVGRGGWMDGWGDVAEGSVRWKNSKDKRVCVMCHNGDRSSAFGFLGKETAETETDKPTEGERETQRRRDDQKDCSHNDEASDWMDAVSIQFALINVNAPLSDMVQQAGDGCLALIHSCLSTHTHAQITPMLFCRNAKLMCFPFLFGVCFIM